MYYNLKNIYIMDTYQIIFKDPYYDSEYDEYLLDIYYNFNGLMLISQQNNKYIDVLTSQEIQPFSDDLRQNNLFLGNHLQFSLQKFIKHSDDVKLSVDDLIKIQKAVIPALEKQLNILKENIYINTVSLDLQDKSLIEYYNDHDRDDYLDEKKEYMKELIYNINYPKREININDQYLM